MPTQRQLRRQARLLAKIRFGGEIGALAQLLADAQSQRDTSISNARAGAGSLVETLEGIRPKIGGAYDAAERDRGAANAEAEAALAGLSGPTVDAIRAGRARERALGGEQLAGLEASAQTDVGGRQVAARSGAEQERRQAEAQYRADSRKVFDSLSELQGRRGAFIETSLADLTEKQRQRAVEEENLALDRDKFEADVAAGRAQRGIDRATLAETKRANRADERQARRDARDKRRGVGGKPSRGLGSLTPEQEGTHVDKIEEARNWANQLRKAGKSEEEVRRALKNGVDQETSSGAKIKIPAYSDLHTNAALDLSYNGHLTRPNVRRLHSRGVHIPGRWRRKKRR